MTTTATNEWNFHSYRLHTLLNTVYVESYSKHETPTVHTLSALFNIMITEHATTKL